MRITYVVILYKNIDEVVRYADKLEQLNYSDSIELIIVVNDIGNATYSMLEKELKKQNYTYYIFCPDKNLGYFNGFIYGINEYMKKNNKLPDWVMFSNTDIDFVDNEFLNPFFNNKYADDVWCVGPSIYVPEKRQYQNPEALKRRSRKEIERLLRIFGSPLMGGIYIEMSSIKHRIKYHHNGIKPKSGYVYEVHGAFFALKKEFVDYIKDKPFMAFLYSEETYVAEQLLICGKKTYYDSDIEIIHNEHSVTDKIGRKIKRKHLYSSMKAIYEEFYKL